MEIGFYFWGQQTVCISGNTGFKDAIYVLSELDENDLLWSFVVLELRVDIIDRV